MKLVEKSCVNSENGIRILNKLQYLFELSKKSPKDTVILEHAVACEKICPTASDIFLDKVLSKNTTYNYDVIRTRKDLEDVGKKYIKNIHAKAVFEQLIQFVSRDTQIKIERRNCEKIVVDVQDVASRFNLTRMIGMDGKYPHAKIACLDGHIETVSEIDGLLQDAVSYGDHLVIICRGADDDVINTIKVNNEKNNFSVSLFMAPFSIETINAIVDVAVVTGARHFSSHSGDLPTSMRFSNCGTCISTSETTDSLRIVSTHEFHSAINQHVSQLREMMKSSHEDTNHIYAARISEISANSIVVRIPTNSFTINPSVVAEIDLAVRIIISAICGNFNPKSVADQIFEKYKSIDANSL